MKKVIAVLVLVAVFATSVFALPGAGNFTFEFDEDASVVELSELEAGDVEGEGGAAALVGAIGGAVLGSVYYCCQETVRIIIKGANNYNYSGFAKGMAEAAIGGAITGAIAGACLPTP